MKKKIAFVSIIIVLAMILSASLVGCAPSRPDLFIREILATERWGTFVTSKNGDVIDSQARNGNLFFSASSSRHVYQLITKTGVEQYSYKVADESWSYTFFRNEDAGTDGLINNIKNSTANTMANGAPDISKIMVDFKDKFEKKDGKWYEKNTQPASLYVKGNKLIYEKNNLIVTYISGYKFKIPNEAYEAKD